MTINGKIVKIKLGSGPNLKTFEVDGTTLAKGSTLLWQQPSSAFFDLANHDPASFEIYLTWLQSDQIERTTCTVQEWNETARAYSLGEEIKDRKFQDYMITLQIMDVGDILPCLDCVNFVYNRLPPGSPFRRLVVNNWIVCRYPKFVDEDFYSQCHPEFLEDLKRTYEARTRPVSFDDQPWNRKEMVKYLFRDAEGERSVSFDNSDRLSEEGCE